MPEVLPDDPVQADPAPQNVETIRAGASMNTTTFFQNLMFKPGEDPGEDRQGVPARAVNTLGEAADSEWYTNRHYRRRMTDGTTTAGTWQHAAALYGEGMASHFR